MNWANVKGVTEAQKETYEIRAPWNPSPATFAFVAEKTQYLIKGKAPTEEGMRKRFKAASLAVFKVSGVYFQDNGIGLDAYGVPKKNTKLKELIQQAGAPTTTTAASGTPLTGSSDTQSTETAAPSVQLASSAATTSTSDTRALRRADRRAHRRALRHARRTAPRLDNRQDAIEHRPKTLYTGQVVTVQLLSNSLIPVYRNVDAKLVPKYSSLLHEEVSTAYVARPVVLRYIPELPFRPAAFDRWLAAVCFGTRTAFPTQDFVCHGVDKGTYRLQEMARDYEGETVDMGIVLETYILSTILGTDKAASDMLFSELQSRVVSQGSGDEGPINAKLYRRMQPYVENDPRLSNLNIEVQLKDKSDDENIGYRPSFATFKDRPSTYQIPSFTDCFNDAPIPYYTTSTTVAGRECPDAEDFL